MDAVTPLPGTCPECGHVPGYHGWACTLRGAEVDAEMDSNESRYRSLVDRFTALGREDWASDLRSSNSYRMQPARLSLATLEAMASDIEDLRAMMQKSGLHS